MPGDDDHTLPLLDRAIEFLQSVDHLQAAAHLGQAAAKQCGDGQRLASHVLEAGPGCPANPTLVPIGEGASQLVFHDAAPPAQAIGQSAEQLTEALVEGGWAAAQQAKGEAGDEVLEEVAEPPQRTRASSRSTPAPGPNCIS